MTRKPIATASTYCAVVFFLFAFLFADGIWATSSSSFIGSALREITAVFRDSATQWMFVLCLACYFIMFLVLKRRLHGCQRTEDREWIRFIRGNLFNPDLWLTVLVFLTLLQYALAYDTASHSIQIPVLIAGIVFGKAIATWAHWRSNEIQRRAIFLIQSLVCLLTASALWRPEKSMVYQYHGISRWIGVWDNPNLYGLLEGVGFILVAGQLAETRSWQMGDGRWRKILCIILFAFAAMLCGVGLFKSYSRGAWLATLFGMWYLIRNNGRLTPTLSPRRTNVGGEPLSLGLSISRLYRNFLPVTMIFIAVAVLAFWQFQFSEFRPAQRVFSVANAKDFSWRNRVTAWEVAVRMMLDRPLTGFGWGQAEPEYGKKYCPPRLNNESAAIEMNDYLMIGISAGTPALFCFVAYLALSLRGKPALPPSIFNPTFSIYTAARAGAIVLLVGFWFDGGLFKLPVAVVFWTLMELAWLESSSPLPVSLLQEAAGHDAGSNMAVMPKRGAWEGWVRWLAGILAVLATAQSAIYLGTPLLSVNDGTLAVARKCLLQQKESEDFEFLSTNAVWHGQKLKLLLEHVQLANYNRQLINWKLDNNMYQTFVLSPVITGDSNEQLNWRRTLWEEFYLRIRHETSPEYTAQIVSKHLHERVSITTLPNLSRDVPAIWLNQSTDAIGFEIIYVAALRSVGVPARLNSIGHAEFWNGNQWQLAPTTSGNSL